MNNQFSIPKPCHENWDTMTQKEKGRFCSVCSKTVTDFTQMSTAEITIYLRQNRGSGVCGRFRNDQLEEKTSINIPGAVLYSQTKFINVFLLALLISMGSMLFSCKDNRPDLIGELAIEPVDTVAVPPPPSTKTKEKPLQLMGMIKYPEDSIAPPVRDKRDPEILMGKVAHDSTSNK